MLSIFCTKVGTAFGPEYVNRLHAMVKRHLTVPHRFVCTTDDTKGINPEVETHPPQRDVWGWWNLMEAYRPAWWSDGPVVYFGLDTVITGNIDRVAEQTELTMMYDFNYLLDNINNMYTNTYADGVTYIPKGGVPLLWERFEKEIEKDNRFPMHVWMTRVLKENQMKPEMWQDVAPGLITSFKWPAEKRELPEEPIVLFHGEPRPIDVVERIDWVKEHWCE